MIDIYLLITNFKCITFSLNDTMAKESKKNKERNENVACCLRLAATSGIIISIGCIFTDSHLYELWISTV